MAHFDMTIPHQLSQEEALQRIKNLLADVKREHADKITALDEKWDGSSSQFTLTIMGFTVSGRLAVQPSAIDIEAELPFAASLFKGKIKELITGKAGELLKP